MVLNLYHTLSRDQQHLDKILNDSLISLLIDKANLSLENSKNPLPEDFQGGMSSVLCGMFQLKYSLMTGISEAQKCIFNLVFSHVKSRELVANTSIAKAIFLRLSHRISSPSLPHDVLLFDLKILFLLTALCSNYR